DTVLFGFLEVWAEMRLLVRFLRSGIPRIDVQPQQRMNVFLVLFLRDILAGLEYQMIEDLRRVARAVLWFSLVAGLNRDVGNDHDGDSWILRQWPPPVRLAKRAITHQIVSLIPVQPDLELALTFTHFIESSVCDLRARFNPSRKGSLPIVAAALEILHDGEQLFGKWDLS